MADRRVELGLELGKAVQGVATGLLRSGSATMDHSGSRRQTDLASFLLAVGCPRLELHLFPALCCGQPQSVSVEEY